MLTERMPNSVLVVSGTAKVYDFLTDLLPPELFTPVIAAYSCGEAKRALLSAEYDIIVINAPLRDEFGTDFALDLVQNSSSAVILLVSGELYSEISYRVETFGVMTLGRPLARSALYSAIKLAVATRARLRAFEKQNRSLTAKMSEIRIVNRAKWALINHLGMSEEQAHRYIEKQAMDLRLTKREVAENIVITYEK